MEIACYIVFGLIISMVIMYFIAISTSKLKRMSDEDILKNTYINVNAKDIYHVRNGSKTEETNSIMGAMGGSGDMLDRD